MSVTNLMLEELSNHQAEKTGRPKKLQNVVKDLKFSDKDFTRQMTIKECIRKQDWLNKPFYPHRKTLSELVATTYGDIPLTDGWKILTTVENPKDHYFGAVYYNYEDRQIVIIHRGTVLTKLRTLLADLEGIIRNQYTSQMSSACSFVAFVLDQFHKKLRESNEIGNASITCSGHSLGGWLAQVTAFTAQYLVMSNDRFRRKHFSDPNYFLHTVAFESPGCKDRLTSLCEDYYYRYEEHSDNLLKTLDISIYLNAPNLINTCNKHIGSLYKLQGEFPQWSALKEHFKYTLKSHKMKSVLLAAEKDVKGIWDWPMVSWPSSSQNNVATFTFSRLIKKSSSAIIDYLFKVKNQEYKVFFQNATSKNNYEPCLTDNSGFIGDIAVHYKVFELQNTILKTSVFTKDELNFLESWKAIKESNVKPLHLEYFLNKEGLLGFEDLLPNFCFSYESGVKVIKCDTEDLLISTVNCTKQLFSVLPGINSVMRRQLDEVPKAYDAVLLAKSNNYISNKIIKSNIDFLDTIGVEQFLESREYNTRYFITTSEDTSLEISRIYNILLKMENPLHELFFTKCCFLSWSQIMDLEKIMNLSKVFKRINLLIIDLTENTITRDNCIVKSLFNTLKSEYSAEKKVILLTKQQNLKEIIPTEYLKWTELKNIKIEWNDIATTTQETLLEKELLLFPGQTKSLSFSAFINPEDLEYEQLSNLSEIITSEMIISLFKDDEIRIESLVSTIDFGEYVQFDEEILADDLVNAFSELDEHHYFIISGVELMNRTETEDKLEFLKILKLDNVTNQEKRKKIECQLDFFTQNAPCTKRILIAPTFLEENNFQHFCKNNSDIIAYWIYFKHETFFLLEAYNAKLSIQKEFFGKQIIAKDIKKELIQPETDLYIFSGAEKNDVINLFDFKEDEKIEFLKKVKDKKIHIYNSWEGANTRMSEFENNETSTHWLHIKDRDIVWQHSHGSLKAIEKFVENNCSLKEEQLIKEVYSRGVGIIVGEPGIGKSLAVRKLTEHLNKTHWVIVIDFRNFQSKIHCLHDKEIEINVAVDFLSETMKPTKERLMIKTLIKYKLEHKSDKKPLMLIFDGFDEINNNNDKKKILALLKFLKGKTTMFITARNHEKGVLQDSLCVFSTEIRKLSSEEQRSFLKELWKTFFKLKWNKQNIKRVFDHSVTEEKTTLFGKYIDALFCEGSGILDNRNRNFLQIPLHFILFAKAFLKHFIDFIEQGTSKLNFNQINIFNLFKYFVDEKYSIYCNKRLHLPANMNKEIIAEPLSVRHWIWSLKEVFGDYSKLLAEEKSLLPSDVDATDVLIDVGLIQPKPFIDDSSANNSFQFVHRTFAEYFSAHCFIYLLHIEHDKIIKFLFTNVLLNREYKFIHIFLNEQLRNRPIQNQILIFHGNNFIKLLLDDEESFINSKHQTALHILSRSGCTNIVKLLFDFFNTNSNLENIIDFISLRDSEKETALYVALKKCQNYIVEEYLRCIEKYPDAAKKNLLLSTVFRSTLDRNSVILTRLSQFIQNYPNLINIFNQIEEKWDLIKLFLESVENGCKQNLEEVLNKAEDETSRRYLLLVSDLSGKTCLHLAAKAGQWEMFDYILDKFLASDLAQILNEKDDMNRTVLIYIIQKLNNEMSISNKKHRRIVKDIWAITEKTLDKIPERKRTSIITVKDSCGMTVLHIAAEQGDWDRVLKIANALPEEDQLLFLNMQNNYGWAVLHYAAQQGKLTDVEKLVRKGADVTLEGKSTVLHEAVCNDDPQVLTLILEELEKKYVDNIDNFSKYVNAKDSKGDTPLMWAAQRGNIWAVKVLLECKVIQTHAQNKNGKTALDWALEKNQEEVLALLQQQNCLCAN